MRKKMTLEGFVRAGPIVELVVKGLVGFAVGLSTWYLKVTVEKVDYLNESDHKQNVAIAVIQEQGLQNRKWQERMEDKMEEILSRVK